MSNSYPVINLLKYYDGKLAYYMERQDVVEAMILKALQWLSEGLTTQGWVGVKNPADLVAHVLEDMELLVVDEKTLVAYSIVGPWFMQGTMVAEDFMAPVADTPAPIDLVVEALRAVGAANGCAHLSIGTRANPRQQGLARLIEQSGCRLSTIELIQDIPNG